jgi:hypothetical protein
MDNVAVNVAVMDRCGSAGGSSRQPMRRFDLRG